jgi:hypothetical protein
MRYTNQTFETGPGLSMLHKMYLIVTDPLLADMRRLPRWPGFAYGGCSAKPSDALVARNDEGNSGISIPSLNLSNSPRNTYARCGEAIVSELKKKRCRE